MLFCASDAAADCLIQCIGAGIDPVIDQLQGEFILLGQLLPGRSKTFLNAVLGLGSAAAQTAFQLLHRGRQQEHGGRAGEHAANIRCAVHIDDQNDHLPGCQTLVHLFAQYRDILALNEPVGRKLDFLTQELNRETNTIGSKCQDLDITRIVVDMKAEIEKIREQIQNLE